MGISQADGCAGYQAFGESDGISHVGSMGHIRHKFVDALMAISKTARHATAKDISDLIGLLYKVQHNIKNLSPEEKVFLHREQAVPPLGIDLGHLLWDRVFLDTKLEVERLPILDERIAHIPPKSLLGKTMSYARIQWCRALRLVDCGLLTSDNNAVENTIRPVALGIELALRRSSPLGTAASVRSFPLWKQPAAKANEIEPQAYLKFFFERFSAAHIT